MLIFTCYKHFLATCFLSLLIISVFGETEKYRLILNGDPSTTITVAWNTTSGNEGTHFVYYDIVDHGQDTSAYTFKKAADSYKSFKGMDNTFARLKGLIPNQAYYFVIGDGDSKSTRFWFKTAPDVPTERLSFIAGGDSRNNQTPRRNANRIVSKVRPHAVMFGGDYTDNSTNNEWKEWFDDWQLTIGSDGRMIPIINTRGNHEDSNDELINMFDTNNEAYYAMNFGGNLVRVYTLNTQISMGGDQKDWLEEDLTNSCDVMWKMAQYHKPMRPHHEDKGEGTQQYNNWADLFYDFKMNLVVESDAHLVKATWPIIPGSGNGFDEGFKRDDDNGTTFIGEGCWGAPTRENDDDKDWTRASGSFNQIKWIFVDQNKIEARTIMVGTDAETNAIPTVNDNNMFAVPANMDIWNPSGGSVITVNPQAFQAEIVSPNDNFHVDDPQIITLETNAGNSPSVASVEFFIDGSSVGTVNSYPYNFNWNIPSKGTYAVSTVVTHSNGDTRTSCIKTITVGDIDIFAEYGLESCGDDAEENSSGTVFLSEAALDLGENNSSQKVGIRFDNIAIPKGATIVSANIQFTVEEASSGACNLTFEGENADNSAPFSNTNNAVSTRNLTNSSVPWSPPSWGGGSVGDAGPDQLSPDIAAIIQEIVNRNGWNSGNSLSVIVSGTGQRSASSCEGTAAPILNVTYINDATPTFPIELLYFEASLPKPSEVEVRWKTGFEINHDRFIVERSSEANGIFEKLKSMKGKGSSSEGASYTFTDKKPLAGSGFYRLKSIDQDGTIEMSPTVEVKRVPEGLLSIYPNPLQVNQELYISYDSEVDQEMTILLMNMNGQAILRREWKVQSGRNQLVVLPKNLTPGIYYLNVFNQQVKETRSLMVN